MRCVLLILLIASAAFSQTPPIEPGVSHDLAIWRAARYSNVRYKLNLTLEKMSPVLRGTIEISVHVSEPPASAGGTNVGPLILDWRKLPGHEKDSTIADVSLNGAASTYEERDDHLIFRDGLVSGENVIKLDFTSPILTSGSAITRYIDKEDGSEYIYSLFVPSDASTAFPCFDQPDLKARFTLVADVPKDWVVVSNSDGAASGPKTFYIFGYDFKEKGYIFIETKPISTYVFAFAAGPWEELSDVAASGRNASVSERARASAEQRSGSGDTLPDGRVSARVYIRKSQAAKFKPHAAEVFRLEREGVKYLEQYFDYKFPFPKLDLVLIPEFPFGGMEHAGAIFLREDRIIFPQEPTKNDYITRANVIFHETAHQWFGDTVTMKWFDDLWLKEGFAEFMAYKTMEKVMPEYNAWKVFYERNKRAAYLTDSTKGTTPIYQPIANLSAAKSAYGNIVYRKAPSFLRQAEFYLGDDIFRTAVRSFLKKHEFANAGWEDLVKELETASSSNLREWANVWVKQPGMPSFRLCIADYSNFAKLSGRPDEIQLRFAQSVSQCFARGKVSETGPMWPEALQFLYIYENGKRRAETITLKKGDREIEETWGVNFAGMDSKQSQQDLKPPRFVFTNYQDHGYGIFLLDDKSRDYILKNIQNEKDDFLRSMMWGSLWDSVREAELDPKAYVELVIKNIGSENDETTIATLLSRVATAVNYYMSEPPALVGGSTLARRATRATSRPPAYAEGSDLRLRLEELLLERLQHASTPGQRVTYYRAYVSIASSPKAHEVLKQMLEQSTAPAGKMPAFQARTKDKFDIVTRLIIIGDPNGPKLLADLEKAETSDEAKRYAYAAHAAFATAENKAKYWNDFVNNKDISESWIESAALPFNTLERSDLTLPYVERALTELPNLKRTRKIFFINNWLGAFIAGQRNEKALAVIDKFLADNPNLDNDLRLKILENVDLIERAVKIRTKFPGT